VNTQIKKFTDLEVWKEAHNLTLQIYKITKNFPKEEQYGLTSQIRRAAISVESCIAEGFSRFHYKDRAKFYYNSRGSLSEVETQLRIAKDLSFIKEKEFFELLPNIEKVGIILGGLIRATERLSAS